MSALCLASVEEGQDEIFLASTQERLLDLAVQIELAKQSLEGCPSTYKTTSPFWQIDLTQR